ncbi:MAG: ABC transporter permease [Propionibacteriaceae bacterium]|jgi:simple sugar transport system permease protein|nr:ABC transporter permease [Propionibacteriaceae bacterium]
MSTTTLDPTLPGDLEAAEPRQKIAWKTPIIMTILGLISLVAFALTTGGDIASQVTIATGTPGLESFTVSLPSQATIAGLSAVQIILAAFVFWRSGSRRHVGWWPPFVFGICFVLAFLLWAVAGKGQALQFTSLLSGALFLSVPLVFGALAGCVCEHVGVVNVAIEGQLLAGAFLAAVVGALTGSPWIGLICAPIAGACVGALLALFAVRYWVDHIIVGVVLNVLVTGVTSYLFSTVLSEHTEIFSKPAQLPVWEIPLLCDIPVLGPVLFEQNVVVYIMYIAVILLQILLFKSRWGLRMRACGEHPKAADTVGIKVNLTRIRNTILGGAIAGLGGAYFTVAAGLAFGKDMSAGRGYIALAAMILGGWSPKGALLAALLFGFADNLQNALGVVGVAIPSQFMLMAPYLVTIFAVAGFVGRVRAPAAEGTAYKGS